MQYLLSIKSRPDPASGDLSHQMYEASVVGVPRKDPWLKMAGVFKDDPTFDNFLAEVDAYRIAVDASKMGE